MKTIAKLPVDKGTFIAPLVEQLNKQENLKNLNLKEENIVFESRNVGSEVFKEIEELQIVIKL